MAFAKENHLNATQNYLNDNPGGCFNLQKKKLNEIEMKLNAD